MKEESRLQLQETQRIWIHDTAWNTTLPDFSVSVRVNIVAAVFYTMYVKTMTYSVAKRFW